MIDLRSDTVTKPTKEMRQAMYDAEVGDDVYGEDPTVNRLEALAADMLGKEAALFVTSGTQGNQIAVLTHCLPGQEIILESDSHIFYYEGAAISALAGVQPRTIKGMKGVMDPNDVEAAIRQDDIHFPETGLICVENTHNRAGGAVVSTDAMAKTYQKAQNQQIPVHLDGARLFNAAVTANKKVADFAQYTSTVQVCLSKGLGAPVGSIIAGNQSFINKARKWRKRLGGGLRQAGILAAPGIIALTQNIDRLAEDHEMARKLATAITDMSGLKLLNSVDTNIVIMDVGDTDLTSNAFVDQMKQASLLANAFDPTTVRLTTHYDVTDQDIDRAIDIIASIAKGAVVKS